MVVPPSSEDCSRGQGKDYQGSEHGARQRSGTASRPQLVEPLTSSANASVEEDAPAAPTPMRTFMSDPPPGTRSSPCSPPRPGVRPILGRDRFCCVREPRGVPFPSRPALAYRSGCDRPPHRRDVRAVPLLPLAGGGLRPERAAGAQGGARRRRVDARNARRRRHACRGGHGSRRRVVQERALGGLQDGRGHGPGAVRPVPAAGGGAERARRGRLAHGRVRGR